MNTVIMTRRFVRSVLFAGLVVSLYAASASAQQTPPKQEEDPFAAVLFPPDLIMQHARAIRLNDEQRAAITKLIGDLQKRAVSLQWQLAEQVQSLKETLARPKIEQDRALDQLNKVLDTEKEIKHAHLEMLLRIKNVLKPEQQVELNRLRAASPGVARDNEPQGES
jgi:Spy/CpxP family protein refolding chaperone